MSLQRTLVAMVALPGLLALFLPFAEGVSPLDVLLEPSSYAPFIWQAASAFLALIIAIWLVRRLFATRLSPFEVVLAYLLSSLAMLSALTPLFKLDTNTTEAGPILSLGAVGVLSMLNFLFLVRNVRKHLNAEDTAEAFLLAGYLPTAVFCLIVFSPIVQTGGKGFFVIHEESGAFAVALACIAYVTRIVLLLRHGGKEPAVAFQK